MVVFGRGRDTAAAPAAAGRERARLGVAVLRAYYIVRSAQISATMRQGRVYGGPLRVWGRA